jgi:hypothetical protein
VAFERIHVSGPEPAERSEPGSDLLKWFRIQPVETALCVHRAFHETGLAQDAQVLRHRRLRHTKLTLDLSHRLLGRHQEAQYRAAVRLRNDVEHGFHALDIPRMAYACQGIYNNGPAARAVQWNVTGEPFWTIVAEANVEKIDDFFATEHSLMTNDTLRKTMVDYHDLVDRGRREIYRIES